MHQERYSIEKPFSNQGGMGLTYLALDNNLNRYVVLKKVNSTQKDGETLNLYNRQFKNEAINQANLTHHNIAKIYDYYEKDSIGHIVMEYVDGQSLYEILKEIRLNSKLEEILDIIYQCIDGVKYAHENGIVHRDIKLENIMYNKKTSSIKIIDFGLSKIKEENREETVKFFGTNGYIPKEVYDLCYGNIDKIDEEKRDIYALGVVAYILLTGEIPYGLENIPRNFKIESAPYIKEYRDDISDELNELFYSMINIYPENRLENLSLVLDAIRKQIRNGYTPLVRMPKFEYSTKIRDAIHGYIKLSKDEMKIVDNRFFQRLRNIKQLGTTYLIYPCAVHSRFEHSLGVMYIATKIFDEIVSKSNDILGWDKDEINKQRKMLRLLSLLHDIGHGPFSHCGDGLFDGTIKNHENMSAKIIRESELKDIINNIGAKNGGFTHNEIAGLIEGKYLEKYRLIKQIFSGNIIDADRMDYLLRDSYMCGVKYGSYDIEHIIKSIKIDDSSDKLILAIDHKGKYVLEEFILARYYMFNQIYYHKTRRIYDKMIEKSIKNYLRIQYLNSFPDDINKFIELDDHKIMDYIKSNSSDIWNKMFLRRNHYKLIYEVFPEINDQDKERVMKIRKRIEGSSIPVDKYIIDEKSKSPVTYRDEEGNPMLGVVNKDGRLVAIDEVSSILKNMNKDTYLFRVYSDSSYINQILKLIEEVE